MASTQPMEPGTARRRRPRVVILGGGFGGLYAARALRTASVDVTVIDRTNHHLFQPLLYQVATAVLAPTDITSPIRYLLRKQQNTDVMLAEATAIDADRRVVVLDAQREIAYDYLIVSTGSRHSYFAHGEWERDAPGLKSIEDARAIRHRFLLAFERAELSADAGERARLLTFVIVGGGATGVELAGIIPDVARGMERDFRHADPRATRIILIEGGPRLLPSYPEDLSERARRDLEELGVEVRTSTMVTSVEPGAVCVGDERIETGMVLWAAGNEASPLARSLGVPLDRAGRVHVLPDLSIPGHPELFVVGDLALYPPQKDGRPVPGVAQGAMQGGRHAAKNIVRRIAGEETLAFRYWNKGDLATIGRYRAIGDLGYAKITGRFAWWFWLLLHIAYLAGFRNRLSVMLEWAYSYFTYRRGARLITKR
ncbi:MAG: NAD(P)/FAD-dependent oxidoreductase [Candidatus Eremiobacteraeota bacterium]|nr:NAD(P)/FAD-dependent oxidoreductase [Candidatus Eremiobacteraeota bacterium]